MATAVRARTAAPRVAPVNVRSRRTLQVVVQSPVTEAMKELARTFVRENTLCNAAKNKADKAKKALNAAMEQAGVLVFEVDVDGKTADCEIKSGTRNFVDVEVLRGLLDEKTFLRVVSATQGAVEEHLGTNILMKCLKEETTAPALKISVRKG